MCLRHSELIRAVMAAKSCRNCRDDPWQIWCEWDAHWMQSRLWMPINQFVKS